MGSTTLRTPFWKLCMEVKLTVGLHVLWENRDKTHTNVAIGLSGVAYIECCGWVCFSWSILWLSCFTWKPGLKAWVRTQQEWLGLEPASRHWHDDVIKWKHFPSYWPFVHKGQWRRALMFSLICASINGWVNNRGAGDLRRHRAHYNVIVMGRKVGSSQKSNQDTWSGVHVHVFVDTIADNDAKGIHRKALYRLLRTENR